MKYNKNDLIKQFEYALELEQECRVQEVLESRLTNDIRNSRVAPLNYGAPIREIDSVSNFRRGREIFTFIPEKLIFHRWSLILIASFLSWLLLAYLFRTEPDLLFLLVPFNYILGNIGCFIVASFVKKRNQRIFDEQYKAEVEEYKEEVRCNKQAIANANKRINVLKCNLQIVKNTIVSLRKMRNELYANDFCYIDYRNLSAVANILQYLKSGRCDSLEGPFGAYNKFAEENNQAILQNKLDIIMASLDEIKETQIYLYNAMRNINYSISNLRGSIENSMNQDASILANSEAIKQNSALTARNSAVTRKHVEFMELMATMKILSK